MPGSEEVSSMDMKDTELTLGLPGGDCGEKSGIKRGFLHTIEFDLGKKIGSYEQNVDVQVEHSSAPKPPPPKAQLVGWPPVRASRKNAMKEMNNNNCKYVKVAVDGAPYLRKVDLQLYSTYQQLLKALEDMFSCFTIRKFFNDGKLVDHVNGCEYVPTYEDKDGDWMMVGDTPWKMFVESCRRIRLMKGSDAIGLESRTLSNNG